jgi:hypothetical protein
MRVIAVALVAFLLLSLGCVSAEAKFNVHDNRTFDFSFLMNFSKYIEDQRNNASFNAQQFLDEKTEELCNSFKSDLGVQPKCWHDEDTVYLSLQSLPLTNATNVSIMKLNDTVVYRIPSSFLFSAQGSDGQTLKQKLQSSKLLIKMSGIELHVLFVFDHDIKSTNVGRVIDKRTVMIDLVNDDLNAMPETFEVITSVSGVSDQEFQQLKNKGGKKALPCLLSLVLLAPWVLKRR